MPSAARLVPIAIVLASACRAREATRSDPPALEPELATSGAPEAGAPRAETRARALPDDARSAHELRTHAGSYVVRWRASIDPIVEGTTFSVDAWVSPAAAPDVLADDVVLDVDAGM